MIVMSGLIYPAISKSQAPAYPIIFIYGLNSDDGTWQTTINYLRNNLGWSDAYFNDQGIFHALLNASDSSTHFGMDVTPPFLNSIKTP